MLVESEREQLLRSEDVLAALSYEPVGFAHAADSLAAARAAPQRFDAVILGAALPDEAALDLAGALHAGLPGVPLVLATASTHGIGARKLLAAGISEIVRRPLV